MSDSRRLPCDKWAEKLAALHPDDLLPAEHEELGKHVATCQGCASALNDYRKMDILIRRSLIIEQPLQLRGTLVRGDSLSFQG